MSIINKQEIRVIGLQRSGNHAIINWILSQCIGKIYFLNFVQPFTNPFSSTYQNRLLQFCKDFDRAKEEKEPTKKDCILYNYEDDNLRDVFNKSFEKNHDKWIGKSLKRYDVLILRDPFNFFASRLNWIKKPTKGYIGKIPATSKKNINLLINLWKMYAKEYLNLTNYMKKNKTVINYNRWFVDKNYRKETAKKLNLVFTDLGMSTRVVSSSFENKKNARNLKVLDRWKNFKDDKTYLKIFEDKRLINLSNKIFGKMPEIKKYIKSINLS